MRRRCARDPAQEVEDRALDLGKLALDLALELGLVAAQVEAVAGQRELERGLERLRLPPKALGQAELGEDAARERRVRRGERERLARQAIRAERVVGRIGLCWPSTSTRKPRLASSAAQVSGESSVPSTMTS